MFVFDEEDRAEYECYLIRVGDNGKDPEKNCDFQKGKTESYLN